MYARTFKHPPVTANNHQDFKRNTCKNLGSNMESGKGEVGSTFTPLPTRKHEQPGAGGTLGPRKNKAHFLLALGPQSNK